MNEFNTFLDHNAMQIAREVDRILLNKIKKIVAALDEELTGVNLTGSLETKHQLRDTLNHLIESTENGRPINAADTIEQLKSLGYQLEMQQPNFHDHAQLLPERDGNRGFRFQIPESEFKVRLYKLEYEV